MVLFRYVGLAESCVVRYRLRRRVGRRRCGITVTLYEPVQIGQIRAERRAGHVEAHGSAPAPVPIRRAITVRLPEDVLAGLRPLIGQQFSTMQEFVSPRSRITPSSSFSCSGGKHPLSMFPAGGLPLPRFSVAAKWGTVWHKSFENLPHSPSRARRKYACPNGS